MEDTSRQEEGGVIFFMQDLDKHLTEWARQWVKSHVLASEKSILIYRNSWKERMAQMTNNKTNSIKPAMKLGDNVKALKMCGLISIYLAWRNLKTGFCHALANFAYPLTACRWFNQLCFELAQLASGDLARQGPRFSIQNDYLDLLFWYFWSPKIFCSDTLFGDDEYFSCFNCYISKEWDGNAV